jgi:hypothetical protein
MLPNFLIIGAQKSASTFVHECLREHPEVFMPRQEIAFFQDPDYLESDISQLHSIFEGAKNHKALGIKCPDYLARQECPARIYKHIPDAKLIVVLRNPVERAVSAYYWYMQVGIIPVRPLEEGINDLISGSYHKRYPRAQEIIDYGFYYEQLMRYLQYFNRKQLLILQQDDLKDSPHGTISQIYKFLDIEEGYLPKALNKQPKQSIYSIPRLKWLAMANRFFYTYRVDNNNMLALYPKKNRLSRLVYYLCVAIDRVLLNFIFSNTRVKISSTARTALVKKYKTDIDALGKFLGKELTEWQQMI